MLLKPYLGFAFAPPASLLRWVTSATMSASNVLGQRDPRSVGEVSGYGVNQRISAEKGVSERHVMHRAVVCGLAQVRR